MLFFFIKHVMVYTSMNQVDWAREGGDKIILDL